MRITQKGQITIPLKIREKYNFLPDIEIEFVEENGRVYLKKANGNTQRGKQLIERMKGKATVRMTTDQILALTRGEKE